MFYCTNHVCPGGQPIGYTCCGLVAPSAHEYDRNDLVGFCQLGGVCVETTLQNYTSGETQLKRNL